jgi:serine/threonine protein kinase
MKGASGESTVIGTEEYQAPELFRGDPQGINFLATDMWSLGAMAFRILTQSPVFTNPYEAFQYLSRPESFLPGTRLDDCHVSPDGRAFTCALLQLDPAQRLDSQAALLQAWITPCLPSAPEMVSSAGDGYV